MRKLAIIVLCLLVVVLVAQTPVIEGKFTVRIEQWAGLFSDEFIHPNPNTAIDMSNFIVKNEGGRSFLEQRQGFIRVYPPLTGAATSISGIYISQIAGDSERVIVALSDGEFYQIAPNADPPTWGALSSGGNNTSPNCTFTMFKDTILATGNLQVRTFAKQAASPGIHQVAEYTGVPYERLLLHQDRIYGYGIDVDSTDSKIVWWPEFSLFIRPDSLDSAVVRGEGGFLYLDKDDGDFITNALPQANHIVFFKSRSIYRVLISPSTNAPNEVIQVASNIGAYGYDCASEYNGVIYFIAENGVYSFDGVNVTKLSDPINYWFSDSLVLSTGQAKVLKTCIIGNKLFCTLPLRRPSPNESGTMSGQAVRFVYDLDLQVWYKLNMGPTALGNESWYMLRYEYSPACNYPLLGGAAAANTKYFGQRMLFVHDSSTTNGKDVISLYPEGWSDRGSDSITCYWSGAFSPLGDLAVRNQLERFIAYGKFGSAESLRVDFSANWQTGIIDSIYVPFGTTPTLQNKRIMGKVEGPLMRYTIRTFGGAPKINYIELVGNTKGPWE